MRYPRNSINIVQADIIQQELRTMKHGGINVVFSQVPTPGCDIYVYMNSHSFNYGKQPGINILLLVEPVTCLPEQYSMELWNYWEGVFDHIYTHYKALTEIKPKQFTWMPELRYGSGSPKEVSTITEDIEKRDILYPMAGRKPAICMIAGNKRSPWPYELYTARKEIAQWFGENSSIPCDVYGTPPFDLPNSKGMLPRFEELSCLAQYTFRFAFENCNHPELARGYVTRKLWDCIETRTIPIYYGAPDVQDYCPKDLFIDFRNFEDYRGLDSYLHHLLDHPNLIRGYQERMDEWVKAGNLRKFSFQTLYDMILERFSKKKDDTPIKVRETPENETVCVIFSKDRAMQLDGCINSLFKHCYDVDYMDVKVLWTASDKRMTDRYAKFSDIDTMPWANVDMTRETDFQADLLDAVEGYKYVMFVTDDTMFVRGFEICDIITALNETPKSIGFSLRLGKNSINCYMQNRKQKFGHDWTIGEGDFGYPLEVSSSLYRAIDIISLLESPTYNNPNTLEAFLDWSKDQFRETKPWLSMTPQSLAFANPLNKVQSIYPGNRSGQDARFSVEHLADLFDKGYRIDISKFDGFIPTGVHQEVELTFIDSDGKEYHEDGPIDVSILFLNYNGGENAKKCIESIRRTIGTHSCEIIVWDNGSTDGSLDYLRIQPDVRLIENPENIGVAARKKLTPLPKGAYIVMCDNDVIFTKGWLDRCIYWAQVIPDLGIVGPRTNYISGPQQIDKPVTYDGSIDALEKFAEEWGNDPTHKGQLWQTTRLPSFCWFVTRQVIERIGNLRSFGKYGFEDDDYSLRCHISGLRVIIDNGWYVHHAGGSLKTGDKEYWEWLYGSWEEFKKAWSLPDDWKYGEHDHITHILQTTPFDKTKHFVSMEGTECQE